MLRVARLIHAPVEVVWDHLARLEEHVTWMRDAAAITFHGDQLRGVGTSFTCLTRVGPLHTGDLLIITRWDEPREMGVIHRGAVTGTGRFVLEARGSHTTELRWEEELAFPWYFAGSLGRIVARPLLLALWRGNLRRLAARIENSESE